MDILDISTPEMNIDQISELKRRLRDAIKNTKINKSCYDPRIVNLPLPNDATITYKYGARAYESDIYNGFIWRNGVWFDKSTVNFDKSECSIESLGKKYTANYNHGTIYSNIVASLINVNIDDTFYPCILNGQRMFIHENWDKTGPVNVLVFEPLSQQIFVGDVSLCRALMNKSKNKKIIYEDPGAMTNIPTKHL